MGIGPKVDNFIETLWFWLPVFALLTCGLWWQPFVEKNWLLPRVWVTCLVDGRRENLRRLTWPAAGQPGK